MAIRYEVKQNGTEKKVYTLEFDLLTGVTLTDVTLTHTPPSGGDDVTPTLDGAVVSPRANVAVPDGMTAGTNYVTCQAVTDDAKFAPEIVLVIDVE